MDKTTPAVEVTAKQDRYHFDGVYYGTEAIRYQEGALTEAQIAALQADAGLTVSVQGEAKGGKLGKLAVKV